MVLSTPHLFSVSQNGDKNVQKYISNLKNEILLLSVKGNIEETEFNDLVEK